MFSFFKKKPPADVAPPAASDPAQERRSWFDRLRGAGDDDAAAPAVPDQPAAATVTAPIAATEPTGLIEAPEAERRNWVERLRGGLRKTGSSITQVFTCLLYTSPSPRD